eukprot:TRINITY_DN32808_c0_g1_i1.p1 TRINITY_DN32808_c0_g1~~TRINITY_DN32808_c0_g1_i1.p1  ORF type:complete len:494 (+),score=103.04 TRINITY_DN32808_c0_g1_i1:65-1546(+)
MKLVKSVQKASALEGQLHQRHPHRCFYQDVLEDVAGMKYAFNLSALWERIAPSGNIYRLNSLQQSRFRHCENLYAQLEDLAEEYQNLLGGSSTKLEQRCAALLESLKATKVDLFLVGKEAENADLEMPIEKTTGFPPLREFLAERVTSGWFTYLPESEASSAAWQMSRRVGYMVFIVQLLGPVLIVLGTWKRPTNYLSEPLATWERLTPRNIFCETHSLQDWCTILMGVMFSFFVVTQLLNSASSELNDAEKFRRLLPYDSVWPFINFVNAWCVLWNIVSLPLAFWAMESAQAVVLGALGVLFLYNLDDLAGAAGSILGTSDSEFRRGICWHYALISHCPVRLKDVVNPDAKSAEDFWQITLNSTGLLAARPSSATGPPSTMAPTRLALSAQNDSNEQTPLLADQKRSSWVPDAANAQDFEQLRVRVRFSEEGGAYELPSTGGHFQVAVWQFIVFVLRVLQVLLPLFYFVVNKPCAAPVTHQSQSHGHNVTQA